MKTTMQSLTLFKQGDRVIIKNIQGNGAFKKRLLELGFLRNVPVTIFKYAPLHDPMELVIKDFHVSLRISEAQKVFVEQE